MPITLPPALHDLTSAEEFLEFFQVEYDPTVLRTSRLHILQRFHDYMNHVEDDAGGATEAERMATIRGLLERAYADFVTSHPLTERVFKVLQDAVHKPMPTRAFVPLSAVTGRPRQPKE